MTVPIQNVYYLLCYAWKHFDSQGLADVGEIPRSRVENLFATVLSRGMRQLIRRGIDRGYVSIEEERRGPRGKVLLSETVKRTLLPAGRVACQYDELTVDVRHNRALKAAMSELLALETVDGALKRSLREHTRMLHQVQDEPLTPELLRGIQLSRNTAHYAFLLNICDLLARSLMPEPGGARRRFHAFTESPQLMGSVFQAFVKNFWTREQTDFHVHAPLIAWQAISADDAALALLPAMRTDVVLENARSRVVVDTKFYEQSMQSWFDKRTLRSDHLYQMHTYLSQSDTGDGPKPEGLLLYAQNDDRLDLRYQLGPYRLHVRSLDLAQPWQDIHRDLLRIACDLASLPNR